MFGIWNISVVWDMSQILNILSVIWDVRYTKHVWYETFGIRNVQYMRRDMSRILPDILSGTCVSGIRDMILFVSYTRHVLHTKHFVWYKRRPVYGSGSYCIRLLQTKMKLNICTNFMDEMKMLQKTTPKETKLG